MGIFGNLNQRPTMAVPEAPKQGGGFFAPGGTGRGIAGYIGDALLETTGHQPIYSPAMQQQQKQQAALRQAMMLAQFKAQQPPDDPSAVRELEIAGIRRGTPEFRDAIMNHLRPPQFLGNPEAGYTGVGGSLGYPSAQPAIPSVTDAASYAAVPSGSQYRDPDGHVRQKP